jgi:SAM-dependent methyltransferase
VTRLASRGAARTEADVQSDVRTLLLYGGLNLDEGEVVNLEAQANDGTRRRLDVEVGRTVIEVKKDLRVGNVRADAIDQLADYVAVRATQTGDRYVGVLTDGLEWVLYSLGAPGDPIEVSTYAVILPDPDVDRLIAWLEAVLATSDRVKPTPRAIDDRLGSRSPGFLLDKAEIRRLYEDVEDMPEVQLKRQLWAKLLTTALGTRFSDTTELFIEHTYLVITAELVAHAVVGFEVSDPSLAPATLISGGLFRDAQIGGVVEADFFDWLLAAPGGPRFVSSHARRLSRFDWSDVEHDVLKVLYESVIEAEQRHSLGEYYTPDWLADQLVRTTVPDPLGKRVLDPACGSGTFIFHAVRAYLAAAEEAGLESHDAVAEATRHIYGMDIHPVAVTLARVTYLLAMGTRRLQDRRRGPIMVPVFLGDSLQWEQQKGLFGVSGLVIPTDPGHNLFADELRFPDNVIADAPRFDQLVNRLIEMATERKPGSPVPNLKAVFNTFAVHPDDRPELIQTFGTMCRLHDDGRNHIWGYYVRNLVRPLWLGREENRVDALVGNPPWLSYRFMPKAMKQRFVDESKARGLWAGAKVATNQDLSAFFVARSVELYLRPEGRLGFVMPFAVLSRLAYAGFRSGRFTSRSNGGLAHVGVCVAWEEAWDLHKVKPTIFPVPASVVIGSYSPEKPKNMPHKVTVWSGKLTRMTVDWNTAKGSLQRHEGTVEVAITEGVRSPYAARFTQGGNLVPRMLMFIEDAPKTPLGVGAGRIAVRSARSRLEKDPWKSLRPLSGVVEREFVHPVLLGGSIAPHRLLRTWRAVLPLAAGVILSSEGNPAPIDQYPGLATWWRTAEETWRANRRDSTTISLDEQINWQGKLEKQFPAAPYRVVYTASGTTLVAAVVTDQRAVIEHQLYWASASSLMEARYLTGVLNSRVLLERIKGLQSHGQFGARHFDSYVHVASYPLFEADNEVHLRIVSAVERAEKVAANVQLEDGASFQAARKAVRAAQVADGVAVEIDGLVGQLLGPE